MSEAAVVLRGRGGAAARWSAYVAGAEASALLDAAVLRQRLRTRLPDYMVPSRIVLLERLPLTANGKVDRAGCRSRGGRDGAGGGGALTPTEELLAGIWECGAGARARSAGTTTSSISAATRCWRRSWSRASATASAVELPLRGAVRASGAARAGGGGGRRRRRARHCRRSVPLGAGAALPLSFAQQRLWFLAQLQAGAGDASYNVTAALRLRRRAGRGGAAAGAAGADGAAGEPADEHPRARRLAAGWCWASPTIRCAVEDLRGLAAAGSGGGDRRRHGERMAAAPFDLAQDRLLRLRLLRLGERGSACCCSACITSSRTAGRSASLVRELGALYAAALRAGRRRRCRRWRSSMPTTRLAARLAAAARCWSGSWRTGARSSPGAPALLELPADHARPAVKSYRGARRGAADRRRRWRRG